MSSSASSTTTTPAVKLNKLLDDNQKQILAQSIGLQWTEVAEACGIDARLVKNRFPNNGSTTAVYKLARQLVFEICNSDMSLEQLVAALIRCNLSSAVDKINRPTTPSETTQNNKLKRKSLSLRALLAEKPAVDDWTTIRVRSEAGFFASLVGGGKWTNMSTNAGSEELSVTDAKIVEIEFVKPYTNLMRLDLHNNSLRDVDAFLRPLTKLQTLNLSYNRLESLPNLSVFFSLKSLYLTFNELPSLNGLELPPYIVKLECMSNALANVTHLSAVRSLETLWLSKNRLTSISGLQFLTNLTWIQVDNNQLTSLPDLQRLTNLEHLFVNKNALTSLSGLASLSKLKSLALESNQFDAIDGIGNLTELKKLTIDLNLLPPSFETRTSLASSYVDNIEDAKAVVQYARTFSLMRRKLM